MYSRKLFLQKFPLVYKNNFNFSTQPHRCVFIRHGESIWNSQNRYTGWADVLLSEKGLDDAVAAGNKLKELDIRFDIVYTSLLTRTWQTYGLIASSLNCHHLPLVQSYKLNTIHYGALEGLDKKEVENIYGSEQIKIWRKSFNIAPPGLHEDDVRHPKWNPKYKDIPLSELPSAESLRDVNRRVLPYWERVIKSSIMNGNCALVVCHETTLRMIFAHLKNITDFRSFDIPNGLPYLVEFDDSFKLFKMNKITPDTHFHFTNTRNTLIHLDHIV